MVFKKKDSGLGFTLIELLIAIAVIGVLAAVILSNLSNQQKKARDAKRKADLNDVRNALQLYYNDSGAYPFCQAWADLEVVPPKKWGSWDSSSECGVTTTPKGLGPLLTNGGYIKEMPLPPISKAGDSSRYSYSNVCPNGGWPWGGGGTCGADPADQNFRIWATLENKNDPNINCTGPTSPRCGEWTGWSPNYFVQNP
jgi:prepilin-type N-terminal cleavage/methylation domain-containing protein